MSKGRGMAEGLKKARSKPPVLTSLGLAAGRRGQALLVSSGPRQLEPAVSEGRESDKEKETRSELLVCCCLCRPRAVLAGWRRH